MVRGKLELQKLSKNYPEDSHIYKRVYMTQHSVDFYLIEDDRKFLYGKLLMVKLFEHQLVLEFHLDRI